MSIARYSKENGKERKGKERKKKDEEQRQNRRKYGIQHQLAWLRQRGRASDAGD